MLTSFKHGKYDTISPQVVLVPDIFRSRVATASLTHLLRHQPGKARTLKRLRGEHRADLLCKTCTLRPHRRTKDRQNTVVHHGENGGGPEFMQGLPISQLIVLRDEVGTLSQLCSIFSSS